MSRCASGRYVCSACTQEPWWQEHRYTTHSDQHCCSSRHKSYVECLIQNCTSVPSWFCSCAVCEAPRAHRSDWFSVTPLRMIVGHNGSNPRPDCQLEPWPLTNQSMGLCLQIDADAAAAQAQQAALRRVGQGGLNEAAGESDTATGAAGVGIGSGRRQGSTAVSETQIVRHPCEVERVLRILHQQINRHGLSW
eukprot:GHUV01026975.1.p1 GENE.GHUV01026975.1~~GHUV01026975.1.p1  ORF type:complete len:193 (-),score=30.92 GHUV01026975.1:920-1498(-)